MLTLISIFNCCSRTKIIEKVDQLKCPILLITGALASHNHTVHRFYNALLQSARSQPERIKNIELVEMDEVANVLRGRPEKVAECLQFFIQGLGLVVCLHGCRLLKPKLHVQLGASHACIPNQCPILLITGALASHNHTVHRFYNALLQSARSQPERIKNIELVEMDEVANVLRGRVSHHCCAQCFPFIRFTAIE
ncbi:hypothetical protein AHF37_11114 [Paragonimus kellicotti]|nr:hypothetical protein AHF37_11114 [Paragonimus kellicotti]